MLNGLIEEQDGRNIKVPIKDILDECIAFNECSYPIETTFLIRRFSISGLNLGYYTPEDLPVIVNRFCSKIRCIKYDYNIGTDNSVKHYSIKNGTLYLSKNWSPLILTCLKFQHLQHFLKSYLMRMYIMNMKSLKLFFHIWPVKNS